MILITSDCHGNKDILTKVIEKHRDCLMHLDAGDSCLDKDLFPKMITVKGNCDFDSSLKDMQIISLEKRILLVHGHLQGVKLSLGRLFKLAKQIKVDIVIFGHTHKEYLQYKNGILFINPGSIGDKNGSYAIYDEGEVTFYQL